MFEQLYICPKCKSTKTVKSHPKMTHGEFRQALPEKVICGWRGCDGWAVMTGEKPQPEKKVHALGEPCDICNGTGIDHERTCKRLMG
jgi:hypothetical protein